MKNKGFLSPVRMNLQQEFCTQNISAYHQFNKDPKEYVFVGEYVGKRFVTCLETYRHIVSVNNEEDISEFLDIFIKFKEEHSLQWINVTKEMDNYLIWCDWKSDIVLGKYWFQVEKINDYNLSPKIPIELLIKILRPVLTREEASQEILQNFLHDTIEFQVIPRDDAQIIYVIHTNHSKEGGLLLYIY
ncbi:uncharacterized protein [Prorops nasuta]|uniref:uncharacterized protein isoform X2 n=1 Tax=Prorops nasuta TaxID=863751 RepID=UPI0034CF28AC